MSATGHPAPSRPRRLGRVAFFAATAALVAWAAFLVPLPVIEYVPASPTAIPPLIEIDGAETTELDGEVALLTVFLRQQPTVAALGALIDPARDLIPYEEIYPPDIDRDEIRRVERERFARQFDIAAAVGASAAGVETELVTEVVIVQVLPGSPASGRLSPGEVVVAVDGDPLGSAEELQAISREGRIGDVLTLTVRRDGERRDVEVELAAFGGVDEPRIGVGIQTAVDEVRLPFEIRLAEDTRIGGPSAGLMVGVTVYDLLSEEDLLAGRYVVGTGTLDADGRVGTVSGVPEKVRSASADGADVMLVPRPHLEEALQAAPDDLQILGVSNLGEALEALRSGAS